MRPEPGCAGCEAAVWLAGIYIGCDGLGICPAHGDIEIAEPRCILCGGRADGRDWPQACVEHRLDGSLWARCLGAPGPRHGPAAATVKRLDMVRACFSKRKFSTQEIAMNVADGHSRRQGRTARTRLRVYECRFCGCWHLTSRR